MGKYWNGRLLGAFAGLSTWSNAAVGRVLDIFCTYSCRRNVGHCGENVIFQSGCEIRYPANISIDSFTRIGRGVSIGSELEQAELIIGKDCWIGKECELDYTGGLKIGDRCTISARVQIVTHSHQRNPRLQAIPNGLFVGNGVWLVRRTTI